MHTVLELDQLLRQAANDENRGVYAYLKAAGREHRSQLTCCS